MDSITRDELRSLIDRKGDYVLVDVREPWEIEQYGMIPSAINIPLQHLPDELPSMDSVIRTIFYCRSGSRSARAAAYAKQQGFNAQNYAGSIIDWSEIDENVKKY